MKLVKLINCDRLGVIIDTHKNFLTVKLLETQGNVTITADKSFFSVVF